MGINIDWEISNLKAHIKRVEKRISELEQAVQKKSHTIYGNQSPGLTTKMHSAEQKLSELAEFKNKWQSVTNIDDFKNIKSRAYKFDPEEFEKMKESLNKLVNDRWFVIGIFTAINLVVVSVGPFLINRIF